MRKIAVIVSMMVCMAMSTLYVTAANTAGIKAAVRLTDEEELIPVTIISIEYMGTNQYGQDMVILRARSQQGTIFRTPQPAALPTGWGVGGTSHVWKTQIQTYIIDGMYVDVVVECIYC